MLRNELLLNIGRDIELPPLLYPAPMTAISGVDPSLYVLERTMAIDGCEGFGVWAGEKGVKGGEGGDVKIREEREHQSGVLHTRGSLSVSDIGPRGLERVSRAPAGANTSSGRSHGPRQGRLQSHKPPRLHGAGVAFLVRFNCPTISPHHVDLPTPFIASTVTQAKPDTMPVRHLDCKKYALMSENSRRSFRNNGISSQQKVDPVVQC